MHTETQTACIVPFNVINISSCSFDYMNVVHLFNVTTIVVKTKLLSMISCLNIYCITVTNFDFICGSLNCLFQVQAVWNGRNKTIMYVQSDRSILGNSLVFRRPIQSFTIHLIQKHPHKLKKCGGVRTSGTSVFIISKSICSWFIKKLQTSSKLQTSENNASWWQK